MEGVRKKNREIIAAVINDMPQGIHLSAGEVFKRVQEKGLDISLSTVYRVLHSLRQKGEIRALAGSRGQRWESSDEEETHDHLICTRCGVTIEFSDDLVSGFGVTLAQRKGYKYHSSRFDIFGICIDCQGKDANLSRRKYLLEVEEAIWSAEESLRLLKEAGSGKLTFKTRDLIEKVAKAIERLSEAKLHAEQSLSCLRRE